MIGWLNGQYRDRNSLLHDALRRARELMEDFSQTAYNLDKAAVDSQAGELKMTETLRELTSNLLPIQLSF